MAHELFAVEPDKFVRERVNFQFVFFSVCYLTLALKLPCVFDWIFFVIFLLVHSHEKLSNTSPRMTWWRTRALERRIMCVRIWQYKKFSSSSSQISFELTWNFSSKNDWWTTSWKFSILLCWQTWSKFNRCTWQRRNLHWDFLHIICTLLSSICKLIFRATIDSIMMNTIFGLVSLQMKFSFRPFFPITKLFRVYFVSEKKVENPIFETELSHSKITWKLLSDLIVDKTDFCFENVTHERQKLRYFRCQFFCYDNFSFSHTTKDIDSKLRDQNR